MTDDNPQSMIPLYFVHVEYSPPPIPGYDKQWAHVLFTREMAQEWAEREERSTTLDVQGEDTTDRFVKVAKVVSADELLAQGGPEALGRVLAEAGWHLQRTLAILGVKP